MTKKTVEGQSTPLMRQYDEVKREYSDAIVLFRMGDFYETFNDDAVTTAKVLGIVLTSVPTALPQMYLWLVFRTMPSIIICISW